MLNAFALVQLAVNGLLIAAVFLLLRRRDALAEAAAEREERLAGLAGELCRLGQQMLRAERREARSAPSPAAGPDFGTPPASAPGRPGMLEGELAVLRNLRRPPGGRASEGPGRHSRRPPARRAPRPAPAAGPREG